MKIKGSDSIDTIIVGATAKLAVKAAILYQLKEAFGEQAKPLLKTLEGISSAIADVDQNKTLDTHNYIRTTKPFICATLKQPCHNAGKCFLKIKNKP